MKKVSVGTSDRPECLEHLRDKPLELELRGAQNSQQKTMDGYRETPAKIAESVKIFGYRVWNDRFP
jgi:hypothetical protein